MAELFLRRTLNGFTAADAATENIWRKYKLNDIYRAKVTKPRNYKHHCMFMALLELTFQNQERYRDFKIFRRAIALAAGHVEQIISLDGEPVLVPLSYSYDELPDEDEFSKAFGAAMTVCAEILHNMKLGDLEAEVSRYADENYGRAAA
jgi:hypothetical protein